MRRRAMKKRPPVNINGPRKIYTYNVFSLIAAATNGEGINPQAYAHNRNKNGEGTQDKQGCKGYAEAAQIMEGHTCETVRTMVQTANINAERHELAPALSGTFYDTVKYIQGQPDCMANFETQPAHNFKEVKINLAIPYEEPFSAIQQRANEVIRAIYDLESSGTRCKVTATVLLNNYQSELKGHEPEGLIEVICKIKDYEEPINPALHGFCLGNAIFYRVYLLGIASLQSYQNSIGACVEDPTAINYTNTTAPEIYKKITQ